MLTVAFRGPAGAKKRSQFDNELITRAPEDPWGPARRSEPAPTGQDAAQASGNTPGLASIQALTASVSWPSSYWFTTVSSREPYCSSSSFS